VNIKKQNTTCNDNLYIYIRIYRIILLHNVVSDQIRAFKVKIEGVCPSIHICLESLSFSTAHSSITSKLAFSMTFFMNKKPKQKNAKSKKFLSKWMMLGIGVAAVVVSIIVYLGIHSLVPVNGSSPVFAAPANTFVKASYSPQSGYVFSSQSTSSAKRSIGIGYNSPTITLRQGELESIHIINEDTSSNHNLNIDAFNVHTKNLGYFGSQTITFIANKVGTFTYYCTIHPEMRGTVVVESQ
jgi:plastocyanin